MCCEHKGHHGGKHQRHHCGCSCCCGGHSGFGPALWTREEKIAWLEEHLQGLREEAKAVEERVAALKAE